MSQNGPTPDTSVAAGQEASAAAVWSQCAFCWGQRQIWEPEEARNGRGCVLIARACTGCLGLGEVLRS